MPEKSIPEHRSGAPLHLAIVAAIALAIVVSGVNFKAPERTARAATEPVLAPSYPTRISVEEQSAIDMLLHEAWTEASFGKVPMPRVPEVDAVAVPAGSNPLRR